MFCPLRGSETENRNQVGSQRNNTIRLARRAYGMRCARLTSAAKPAVPEGEKHISLIFHLSVPHTSCSWSRSPAKWIPNGRINGWTDGWMDGWVGTWPVPDCQGFSPRCPVRQEVTSCDEHGNDREKEGKRLLWRKSHRFLPPSGTTTHGQAG